MIKMNNCFTGIEFWVADDRVEEYKAAGHKLAADLEKPKSEVKQAEKSEVAPVQLEEKEEPKTEAPKKTKKTKK
jgi:hypothetical protein